MTKHSNNRLQQGFVLLLLAIVLSGFLGMIRNFLIAMILAAIFSGLLYPFYSLLRDWLGGRKATASVVTLSTALVAIGLPVIALMSVVAREALQLSQQWRPAIKNAMSENMSLSKQLPDWMPFSEKLEPYRESIFDKLASVVDSIGSWLLSNISAVTQDTFGFVVSMFILLYAMFYFFINGAELLRSVEGLIPLPAKDRDMVLDRGLSVTRASLKGILLVGLLQGILVGLAFWVCGLPAPVFWGAVVFILSAIPGLGAPIIWIPAVVYLIFTDNIAYGIGLALWGAVVVGLVDNFLRPMIVGRDAKLPDIVILVSILGGIATFGVVGLIIGPIIAACLDAVLNIYRRMFADNLS